MMYGMNPYYQNPYSPVQTSQLPSFMQGGPLAANGFTGMQETKITVAQVPTIEQVERVQMLPGEIKIVLVQNNPDFLAIRAADNAGFVTTQYRTSTIIDPKTMQSQAQYASVQSVAELKNEINEIKKALGGALNAIPNTNDAAGA